MESALLPLNRRDREAAMQRRYEAFAAELAPLIVAPVESLIAEQFNQRLVEPVAGRVGYQDLLRLDTPAAGADARYTVPGDRVLWPLSVICTFTTSGVAGDRTLAVEYQDNDRARYLIGGAPVTVSASDSRSWCWQPLGGESAWPVENAVLAPLPQQHIYPGNSLVIRIGNPDAADQLSAVRISAWFYPTGPQGWREPKPSNARPATY